MVVLVTGADGQLGKCIADSSKIFNNENTYYFFNRKKLDITNCFESSKLISEINPDVIINCAAYTDVKGAENNQYDAMIINEYGPKYLVEACKACKSNPFLIHISTDFVFDGYRRRNPYTEDDITNPLNVYGKTKKEGENAVIEYEKGIVIRTSWLYSEYGKNFYRVMSERIHFKMKTNVINDQIGTPTYARELSDFIVNILIKDTDLDKKCGLYHFSNNGQASWYDFASSIETLQREVGEKNDNITHERYIIPTTTEEYGDKVRRPKYSVLCKDKIEEAFNYVPDHWLSALVRCMKNDDEI